MSIEFTIKNTPMHQQFSIIDDDQESEYSMTVEISEHLLKKIIDDICTNFEIDDNCLKLNGRVVILKDSLVTLITVGHRFFIDPANAKLTFCQVDTTPIINEKGDKTDTVSVVINTEAYHPDRSIASATNEMDDVVIYPNPQLADILAHSSFCINRQFQIFKLPDLYAKTPLISGAESSVFKIINLSKGGFTILKTPLQSTRPRLMQSANEKFCLQQEKVSALYYDVQRIGKINIQKPSQAIIDLCIGNRTIKGSLEHFYKGGDLFDVIISPRYSEIVIDERIAFCFKIGDSLCKLTERGYYHRDVKIENILMEPNATGYDPVIADYADSIHIKTMFDRFETMLRQEALTLEDSAYLKSLKEAPCTAECIHYNDTQPLSFIMFTLVKHIFKIYPHISDLELRLKVLEEFKIEGRKLFEASQVFALGIVFFNILFCTSPHVNIVGHPHDTEKPLHKAQNKMLFSKLIKKYPYHGMVEMVNLIKEMMLGDYRLRPSLAKVTQKFAKLINADFSNKNS